MVKSFSKTFQHHHTFHKMRHSAYYAGCRYAERRYADCRYADCRYAERRGAIDMGTYRESDYEI
jgi:hypothetical protein